MKNLVWPLLAGILVSVLTGADSSSATLIPFIVARDVKPNYHSDRVIVQMKASTSPLKTAFGFQKSADANGLTFDRTLSIDESSSKNSRSAIALMKIDTANDTVEDAIARLKTQPDVEFAQPDFIYSASAVPNDPNYSSLWGLKNTGQTISSTHLTQQLYATGNPGTAGKDMGLETAWDTVTDCSSVIVAVIDTGVDLDHDDLKTNLWTNGSMEHGYDFVNSDTDPSDDYGHGSHVAGTIGARGNNGILSTGVCWKVQLMAIKVLDASGSGSTSTIISGVNFARTNGAHIINMSLGGTGFDQLFFNALKAASDANILTVVAAGNNGTNNGASPIYPCNYDIANIICVGAVDQTFARASFSNYSTTYVDIGAPGTNIVSTIFHDWGAPIAIPLASGSWTTSTANFVFTGGFLQNPATWDGASVNYTNNQDDNTYTSVDMTGTVGGTLTVALRGESQANTDYLGIYENGAGGNPTTGGTRLARVSGSTSGALASADLELSSCAGMSTCTIGFRFTSDAATTKVGWRIQSLSIDRAVASTSGLDSYNGTSMASPHVAGLAALVKSHNPTFTAADLKNAILLTGTTVSGLSSYFKSGSVANAPNALKFVDAPLGVSAAVVP